MGFPSKSENRLSRFLKVLWRNMQISLEEQTRKRSPWVHRVWDLEEACGKEGSVSPGLRANPTTTTTTLLGLCPRRFAVSYHSLGTALVLCVDCRF